MIDTNTVMPRVVRQQTSSFTTAIRSLVEAKEAQASSTMKAIYLASRTGAEGLVAGEILLPSPKADEVLVKVHATSVTPAELEWFTTFNLPFGEPRPFPIVLSHEFSGVVESVGRRVTGFTPGDEVFGLNDWFMNGAQAEYCVAKATALARKPKTIYHVQAGVVPISALTAWQGLFTKAKLERYQRILIHGAAGGVGSFAVQLARWRGARVIAPVSSGHFDFVRSLGADELIDYRTTRFEDVVKDLDVVFDAVGGEILERSWGLLAKGGRIVTVATQSRVAADQRVRDAFMMMQADGPQLAEIGRMIDRGELSACVGPIFPLTAAKLAYARARHGLRRGKVALRVAGLYANSNEETQN
jgi:NADPH:quinone reductase-like Zn-dependent oxidoreductase